MKEIIKIRYCDHCGKLIPETRNMGSLYCTNKCGWTFRNRRNAQEKKDMQKNEPGLYAYSTHFEYRDKEKCRTI
ncbi:MAG: hypothetical protein MUO72_16890 [Bacteroidales bacterium]|nr:hypothetical protein [Bacteroidales bacterium]